MLSLVQGSIEYINNLATNYDESSRKRIGQALRGGEGRTQRAAGHRWASSSPRRRQLPPITTRMHGAKGAPPDTAVLRAICRERGGTSRRTNGNKRTMRAVPGSRGGVAMLARRQPPSPRDDMDGVRHVVSLPPSFGFAGAQSRRRPISERRRPTAGRGRPTAGRRCPLAERGNAPRPSHCSTWKAKRSQVKPSAYSLT